MNAVRCHAVDRVGYYIRTTVWANSRPIMASLAIQLYVIYGIQFNASVVELIIYLKYCVNIWFRSNNETLHCHNMLQSPPRTDGLAPCRGGDESRTHKSPRNRYDAYNDIARVDRFNFDDNHDWKRRTHRDGTYCREMQVYSLRHTHTQTALESANRWPY